MFHSLRFHICPPVMREDSQGDLMFLCQKMFGTTVLFGEWNFY